MWPNYLYCSDENGRKAWQFPARLVFPTSSDRAAWRDYESIGQAALDPQIGVIYVLGQTNALYAINVRDGKVLWKKTGSTLHALVLAPYQGGCFLLTGSSNDLAGTISSVSLAWVDGKTGKLRWLTRLPPCTGIEVDGGDLFAVANTGDVRAYSASKLLALRAIGQTAAAHGVLLRPEGQPKDKGEVSALSIL